MERPQSIEVRVYDLRVLEASTDRMLVEFVQFYASDRLRVYSLKKQVWTREGDGWRIQAEEAVDLPKRHAVVREGLERPLAIAPAQPAPPRGVLLSPGEERCRGAGDVVRGSSFLQKFTIPEEEEEPSHSRAPRLEWSMCDDGWDGTGLELQFGRRTR